jgi:ribosomal protein RSM22 (predicted rRNA methylase)
MLYPTELESWWLAAAGRATGCADPIEAMLHLEGAAAQLSDHFTVARPEAFVEYASKPATLAAYGLLFFPQTFARVSRVLQECRALGALLPPPPAGQPAPPFRLLDLGSGAGASTLAAALLLPDRPVALHAVDHAPAALQALQQLFADCRALWPAATLTTRPGDLRTDGLPGAFDLILASFVLNESFPDPADPPAERWVQQQLARLAPGGLLVILEPAGTATCNRLQRLRDRIAGSREYTIVAPCPHAQPCPLLASGNGFCHDVRSWSVPDSVNRMNRRLQRAVHTLKYGFLVLQRTPAGTMDAPAPATELRARLAGPMSRDKGRLATYGCCSDGSLRKIELMTRHLTREELNHLIAQERGDRLLLKQPRLLGDGRTWRVEALETFAVHHPPPALSPAAFLT